MASASYVFEHGIEETMQCIICQEEYNSEDRIPKFLNCFHSFCVKCIKSWAKNTSIECPKCRETTPLPSTVSDMKTNQFILDHIEFRTKKTAKIGNFLWCFPCGKAAQLECGPSGHKLFMVENIQVCKKLKQLNDDINECKTNWSLSIQNRLKLRRSILDHVIKSLKTVQDQLNDLVEQNNVDVALEESLLAHAEQPGWDGNGDIDIQVLAETYANNTRDSRKHLQNSEHLVARFDLDPLRRELMNTVNDPSNSNGDKIIDFSFDWNRPILTVATYAIAAMLKTMSPTTQTNKPTTADPEDNGTLKKSSEAQTTAKSFDGYAAALCQNSVEQNGQFTRPLSSGQVCRLMAFEVDGRAFGKVTILLDEKAAPIMCKTFNDACLGNNAKYKGTRIFQCKEGEFICGGRMEETGLAETYIADKSTLKDELGVIRMRRRDKEKTVFVGTEFQISLGKGPYMNYQYTTVFGRVFEGLHICEKISELNPFKHDIRISDCGVL